MKKYSRARLQSFAKVLGDTYNGMTGHEIEWLLEKTKITDIGSTLTKESRLYLAFRVHQRNTGDDIKISKFIGRAVDLVRRIGSEARYKTFRKNLNKVLFLERLIINEKGKIVSIKNVQALGARIVKKAQHLREVENHAREYHAKLESLGVHHDVLEFCSAELAENNYFHAILEATKSIDYKLSKLAKADKVGNKLAEHALSGNLSKPPLIKINDFKTQSDRDEQRGFFCLVQGVFSMFRNRIAHDARIRSKEQKDDFEALLLLVSLIHRRLDKATVTRRIHILDASMLG